MLNIPSFLRFISYQRENFLRMWFCRHTMPIVVLAGLYTLDYGQDC